MSIIQRIFDELANQRKKPADLARFLGVSTGQMSTWKKRETDPPAKLIPQICVFLGRTPEFILTGKEKEPSGGQLQWYDSKAQPLTLPDEDVKLSALRADQALTARIQEVAQEVYDRAERRGSKD